MSKKYELVKNDSINYNDHKLYRIKALKDFSDVKKGDLGGYVERELNLDQDDNCWVYDNAKVYGIATVYGDAKVFDSAVISFLATVHSAAEIHNNAIVTGDAEVFGNAIVADNAKVCDSAIVCDNAQVLGEALVHGDAKVYNNVVVRGNAIVSDNAWAFDDNVKVFSNAEIYGKDEVKDITKFTMNTKMYNEFNQLISDKSLDLQDMLELVYNNEIKYSELDKWLYDAPIPKCLDAQLTFAHWVAHPDEVICEDEEKYRIKIMGKYVYKLSKLNYGLTEYVSNAYIFTQKEIDEMQKLPDFKYVNLNKCKEIVK